MSVHELTIPQSAPWVSMNDRPSHWSERSGPTWQWRNSACIQARCNWLPHITVPVTIDAVVHKVRNGRWDAHNLMPTVKAAIDGLVDAGVIVDDDNRHLIRVSIEAGAKSATPCLHLTITTTEGDH